MTFLLGSFGVHPVALLLAGDARLAARGSGGLDGIDLVAVHRRATGGTFEPLLFGVLARDHACELRASRAEWIGLGAGFTEPKPGGCSVGDDGGAIKANDLSAFTWDLVAEATQVAMANGAGSNWQSGTSLVAFIIDFDWLVDTARGAGDGGMRGAAGRCEAVDHLDPHGYLTSLCPQW